ncbi:MAG TPA: toll/interleukin-1 receptor domain-containing protein [Micromonosporaceae bacterium]|jgi:hypothetical protein
MLGDIPLLLTETRGLEFVERSVGSIRFGHWQVHPVPGRPESFPGLTPYLVRVNVEFGFGSGLGGGSRLAPGWVEVGFEFGPDRVSVVDALPRAVTRPDDARPYEVTPLLAFAPAAGPAPVAMPPVTPRIECSGIGSSAVRWRYSPTETDPVPSGAQVAWLVLLVPEGRPQVEVVASAGYGLAAPTLENPTTRDDAFAVDLPPVPGVVPGPPLTFGHSGGSPRVFVTYAHENEEHKRAVAEFCDFLVGEGLDVRYDQQEPRERREWQTWTTTHILRADFVIAVASPSYRKVSEGRAVPNENRGVQAEYLLLSTLLADDRPAWTRKILPVVLPGRSVAEIPLAFLPRIATHYIVDDFTAKGAAELVRVLKGTRDQ